MQSDENDQITYIEEDHYDLSNRILFFKKKIFIIGILHFASWLSSFPPSRSSSLIGYKVCVGDMEFIRDEYATQA